MKYMESGNLSIEERIRMQGYPRDQATKNKNHQGYYLGDLTQKCGISHNQKPRMVILAPGILLL